MKKIISLTLALITVLTLTVSTLATAVTAQAVSDCFFKKALDKIYYAWYSITQRIAIIHRLNIG